MNFYPRPPRGGRQKPLDYGILGVTFLSTPSARRATANLGEQAILKKISIHALREEGDESAKSQSSMDENFYPRPPRGGRRLVYTNGARSIHFYPRPPRGGRLTHRVYEYKSKRFLSTPSARRATSTSPVRLKGDMISIHALREEGDRNLYRFIADFGVFLSTPSARRATTGNGLPPLYAFYFYPRPPRGGRPGNGLPPLYAFYFYPRPPRGGRPQ